MTQRSNSPARQLPQDLQSRLALLWLVRLFRSAVAAQYLWQVLRKCRARHHHVAAGFLRLQLQLTLDVREEANDIRLFLQLRLQFGDSAERLCRGIVQVEDDQ